MRAFTSSAPSSAARGHGAAARAAAGQGRRLHLKCAAAGGEARAQGLVAARGASSGLELGEEEAAARSDRVRLAAGSTTTKVPVKVLLKIPYR